MVDNNDRGASLAFSGWELTRKQCPTLAKGDGPSSIPYGCKHVVRVPKTSSICRFLRSLDRDSSGPAGFVVGVQ